MGSIISIEEHKELGKRLKELDSKLSNIHLELARQKGKTNSEARFYDKTHKLVRKLRTHMEEIMFHSYPDTRLEIY